MRLNLLLFSGCFSRAAWLPCAEHGDDNERDPAQERAHSTLIHNFLSQVLNRLSLHFGTGVHYGAGTSGTSNYPFAPGMSGGASAGAGSKTTLCEVRGGECFPKEACKREESQMDPADLLAASLGDETAKAPSAAAAAAASQALARRAVLKQEQNGFFRVKNTIKS